ncbi:hypothetical protein D3C75_841270 [compost metagenome]
MLLPLIQIQLYHFMDAVGGNNRRDTGAYAALPVFPLQNSGHGHDPVIVIKHGTGDKSKGIADSVVGGAFALVNFPAGQPRPVCDLIQVQMTEPAVILLDNLPDGLASDGHVGPGHKLGFPMLPHDKALNAARLHREYLG